jgi:D-alanyl-D-alanine carboxypeptidase (penicillin-binding protein 5/6)
MEKNKVTILVAAFLCLGLLFMLTFQSRQMTVRVSANMNIDANAKAAVLIEANSGRVLFEKNSNLSLPMASTTKIMTAYSVLKRVENLDTKVEISSKSVGVEGTSMYLKKGDIYTIKDLLKGMLLASGNDASVALALHFSGSVEEFALIMNADAKEMGLKNTSFANPHGLDQKNHYTSAHDLAIITTHAMKYDFFKEIVKQKSDMVAPVNSPDSRMQTVVNKNKLLGNFAPATGVKIGFTDDAGRCLVSSGTQNGLDLVCVVLNCPDMFRESKKLLEYGFENYIYTKLLESYKIHRSIAIKSGREKDVKICTKQEFFYPLTLDESYDIEYILQVPDEIKAPIEKEELVGQYKIMLKDKEIFCCDVYALDKVKSVEFNESLKDIMNNW